jgi:hypothetical protein
VGNLRLMNARHGLSPASRWLLTNTFSFQRLPYGLGKPSRSRSTSCIDTRPVRQATMNGLHDGWTVHRLAQGRNAIGQERRRAIDSRQMDADAEGGSDRFAADR